MLNGWTVYSLLDCTSGYLHIALSSEAEKKSAFMMPFGKFEFKKVPFGLAQAPTHFQQLRNEVPKGLPFAFGYLDILVFSENNVKTPQTFENCVW